LLTVVLILLSGPFVIIGLGGSVDPEGLEDSPGRAFFVCMAGIALAMMIRPMFIRVTAERRARRIADALGVPCRLGPVRGRGRSGWVSFF
jgi:hypothetical protein